MKPEIIKFDGQQTIDSREVAKMIGKQHKNLIRDIRRYIKDMEAGSKLSPLSFFIKSSYEDAQGKTRDCYLLTKKGCEFVANKMTGQKGTIFTAQYVTLFNDYEQEQLVAIQHLTPEELEVKRAYIAAMNRQTDEIKRKNDHNFNVDRYRKYKALLKMANKTHNPIYLHEIDRLLLPVNVEYPTHLTRRLTNQIDLF